MEVSIAMLLLGFSGAAWLFTVGAGIYAFWRYAYTPFRVVRRDIVALAERQDKAEAQRVEDMNWLRNEMGLRKAASLSNEELAEREMKLRARRLWPSANAT